jgi:hypothetical protein
VTSSFKFKSLTTTFDLGVLLFISSWYIGSVPRRKHSTWKIFLRRLQIAVQKPAVERGGAGRVMPIPPLAATLFSQLIF